MQKSHVVLYNTSPQGYMLPGAKRREVNGVLESTVAAMWRGLREKSGITKGQFSFFHRDWAAESIGRWAPPNQPSIVFEVFAIDIPPDKQFLQLREPDAAKSVGNAAINGARWCPIERVLKLDVKTHVRWMDFKIAVDRMKEHVWVYARDAKNSTTTDQEGAAGQIIRDHGEVVYNVMKDRRDSRNKRDQMCHINGQQVDFTPDSGATSSCITYATLQKLGAHNYKIKKLTKPYSILLADGNATTIKEHIFEATITITAWSGARQSLIGCEIILMPGNAGPLLLGRPQLAQLRILPLRVQVECAVNRHAQEVKLKYREPTPTARAVSQITTYSHKFNKPPTSDEWGDKMTNDDIDAIAAPNLTNPNYESERRVAIESMIGRIDVPDMSNKGLVALKKLIWKYEACFHTQAGMAGAAKVPPLDIKLKDSTREFPRVAARKYSPHHTDDMKRQVKAMEEAGILSKEPVPTPYVSPALCVKKPSGEIRICSDARLINSLTENIVHPLPFCHTITRDIHGHFFMTTDLLKFYWQLPLSDATSRLCGLLLPWGVWQYRRCPMGLKQSAAHATKILEDLLRGVDNCKSYVDDVVCYHIDEKKY